ncbi:ATP-binding protein [SAR202 cluster bacterium AD-812-D07_MRT_10900m]|nr:ATP-binding protein [SAR202 cluster bacterium AD-812-D07_MRT_10900m]
MPRTKKVLNSSSLRSSASGSVLNVDHKDRSVIIGRRLDAENSAIGYLGKVCEQSSGTSLLDYSVWLDLAFPHVIGIFGTRGSGKSFDLGAIIEFLSGSPDITSGDIPSTSSIVFDIQNQFWTLGLQPDPELAEDSLHLETLEKWGLKPGYIEDLKLWLPSGNESTLDTSEFSLSPDQLTSEDWLGLLEIETYSPMGQAMLTLLDSYPNLEPRGLADRAIPGADLVSFQESSIDGLRWRLESLAETHVIGDQGVNIDELLVRGRVSVLLLRDVPDSLKSLIVGVIARLVSQRMGAFHQSRRIARRQRLPQESTSLPTRVSLVIDEAHVVVPANGTTPASAPIVDYVKRGRDAGLSLIFATQRPSAVETSLMSQVDLTLTHSLGFEADLNAAIQRMPTRTSFQYESGGTTLSNLAEVARSISPGQAIIADAASARAFVVQIRPRVTAHGGNAPDF